LPNGIEAMQTNVREAVRDALTALIDYAGLFPPARLPMAQAVPEYLAARAGAYAWMLGRFIVPCSRTAELIEAVPGAEQCAISLILDGGIADVPRAAELRSSERRLAIEALEILLEPSQVPEYAAQLRAHGLSNVPSYVEFRRDGAWTQTLAAGLPALGRYALSAKVRCGGVVIEAFPTPSELASFIEAAAREQVPFKATAGLHHPVRHLHERTGFTMHGFLNLLAAAALAQRGASFAEIERTIASENAAQFAGEITAAARELFTGYGSCSFEEPVEDLRAMGVLA
jgi:hypothetical protein